MGVQSSRRTTKKKNKGPDPLIALEAYWKKTQNVKTPLSKSQDNREIRHCFNQYDFNKSGALEKDEALCYINDMLKISRFDKKIKVEAEKLNADPEEYLMKYTETIFREMDGKNTGRITLDQLVKPHLNEWTEFLRWVSLATLHEIKKEEKNKRKQTGEKLSDEEAEDGVEEDEENEKEFKKVLETMEADDEECFTTDVLNRPGDKALGEEDIIYLRQQKVKDVCDVLQVDKTVCMLLLNKFTWDVQKLLVAFAEDPEKTFESAGISPSKTSEKIGKSDRPKEIECSVCFEDKEDYTILESCGHEFCNECWEDSFNVQINEGQTFQIHCMRQGCKELVPDDLVQKIVKPQIWDKYVKFLSKHFIESSKGVRWCPAPGCNKVISEPMVEGDNLVGECTCGLIFCWYCKKFAHTPITCKEYGFWEEENPELGQALLNAWLYQHTKPCPKCANPIEKNDGCFHMSCRCSYQFCWGCRKQWGTSGCSSGQCNTYRAVQLQDKPTHHKEEGVYGDEDERKFARLEKVKEFFQAEEYQKARDIPIRDLIEEISNKDGLFSPKIINNARMTIAQCRRIMKCMAIKQYLVKTDQSSNEIVAQQERLQFLIEGLVQKVEKDFLNDKKYDMKMMTAVQQMTNSVSAMLHNCLLSDSIEQEKEEKEEKEKEKDKEGKEKK